jgi:hypothetical protein
MKENPIGLPEDTAKKLIVMAGKALSLIGKKPRYTGIAIGLLLAGLITAGYFTAGQAIIYPHLPNTNVALGTDVLAILAALGIGYAATKTYIKSAMQKSLETLFSEKR